MTHIFLTLKLIINMPLFAIYVSDGHDFDDNDNSFDDEDDND